MKKTAIIAVILFVGNIGFSQKMMTHTGGIKFEATMPGIEEIAATNNTVSCILDEATGDIAALALVKAFKFKSPLMEEHFNENYLESSKFPKASFKGKILNFDAKKLTIAKTVYDLEGELTMHGISRRIKTKITFLLNGEKVNAVSNLSVKPQDYNIEIPSLVKNKIAENVKMVINLNLEAK